MLQPDEEARILALRDRVESSLRAQAALAFEVADPALVAELGRVMREDPDDKVRQMAENAHWSLARK